MQPRTVLIRDVLNKYPENQKVIVMCRLSEYLLLPMNTDIKTIANARKHELMEEKFLDDKVFRYYENGPLSALVIVIERDLLEWMDY